MGYQAEALKHFRDELSGPQRRVLRSLATLFSIASSEEWQPTRAYNGNTLMGLERRGLVETRESTNRLRGWEVRLTEKGKSEATR